MPYVRCHDCATRVYRAPSSAAEPCPVCDTPLPGRRRRAAGPKPQRPADAAQITAPLVTA